MRPRVSLRERHRCTTAAFKQCSCKAKRPWQLVLLDAVRQAVAHGGVGCMVRHSHCLTLRVKQWHTRRRAGARRRVEHCIGACGCSRSVSAPPTRGRCWRTHRSTLAVGAGNRPGPAWPTGSTVSALEPAVRSEFAPPQVELDLRNALLAALGAHAHGTAFKAPKPLCPLVPLCQIDWPCHVCTPMRGTLQQPTHASLTQPPRMVWVDGYVLR